MLLAIRQHIPSLLLPSPDDLELLLVQISSNTPFRLCLIYNPPNSDNSYIQNLITFLQNIAADTSLLIIMGDFNSPNVDWSTLSGNTYFSNQLCDLMFQFNLNQIVNSPTHIYGNMLDLVITNSYNFISSLTVHSHCDSPIISDHHLISFKVSQCFVKHKKSVATFIYDFSKGDYHGMHSYLLTCDLSDFYSTSDVEEAWQILKQHINFSIDTFVPKVKLHSTQHPKWFNPQIRHHIKCLRTLRRKTKKHFTESNLQRLIYAEDTLLNLKPS